MARTRWIASAAVALLAAAPYIRSVGFEFVLDDLHLIVHNAFLRQAWSPITAFAHDFWHGTSFGASYYRPVVTAAFLAVPILALRRMKDPDGGIRDCRPVAISVGAAALVSLAARRALGLGLLMAPGLIDPLTNPLALLPRSARLLAALRLAGRYM